MPRPNHVGSDTTSPPALDLLDTIPIEVVPTAILRLSARLVAMPKTGDTVSPVSDELLNPKQAAALLHTSVKYIHGHIRDLGGVRLGRGPRARLRFKRATLLGRVNR